MLGTDRHSGITDNGHLSWGKMKLSAATMDKKKCYVTRSLYRAAFISTMRLDAGMTIEGCSLHPAPRGSTVAERGSQMLGYMQMDSCATSSACSAKRRRLSSAVTVGKAADTACCPCSCLDGGRCGSNKRNGVQLLASCSSVSARWRLQQQGLPGTTVSSQLSGRKRQQEHSGAWEPEALPPSPPAELGCWIEPPAACAPLQLADPHWAALNSGLRLRPLGNSEQTRAADWSASRAQRKGLLAAAEGNAEVPGSRPGPVGRSSSSSSSLRTVPEAPWPSTPGAASDATLRSQPAAAPVVTTAGGQRSVTSLPCDAVQTATSAVRMATAASSVVRHTITSGGCTFSTATSPVAPAPLVWRRAGCADAEAHPHGPASGRVLVVDVGVEVAQVPRAQSAAAAPMVVTSGVSAAGRSEPAAPRPAAQEQEDSCSVAAAGTTITSNAAAAGNQAVRLLLRLRPLLQHPGSSPAAQSRPAVPARESAAGGDGGRQVAGCGVEQRGASCGEGSEPSTTDSGTVRPHTPEQQPPAPPLSAEAVVRQMCPGAAAERSLPPPELALPSLERLLQAAAAASSAATACARSLAPTASIGGFGRSSGCLGVVGGQVAPLALMVVRTEAFFQPDGSLLQGAVLQAACNVIRVAQLRGGVTITSPWGRGGQRGAGTNGSSSGGSAAGPPAAAPPPSRPIVPLSAALQLLVLFAGASRALELAAAGLAEEPTDAAAPTTTTDSATAAAAAAAAVPAQAQAAAAGYRSLWPLMRRGRQCAEVLMAEVERALTEAPELHAA